MNYLSILKKFVRDVALLTATLTLFSGAARTQSSIPEMRNNRGTFNLSELEKLNLETGKLTFRLPLVPLGGRGLNNDVHLTIEQTWGQEIIDSVMMIRPNPYAWNGVQSNATGYIVGSSYVFGTYELGPCSGEPFFRATSTDYRINFTTYGGLNILFRAVDGDSAPTSWTNHVPCTYQQDNIGDTFVAWDGSGAKLILDDPIVLSSGPEQEVHNTLNGTVKLADGTTYRLESGKVAWVQDRNGNRAEVVTSPYGADPSPAVARLDAATDPLKRAVTVSGGSNSSIVSYKGTGGAPRDIVIRYDNMGDVLESGESLQTLHQLFPTLVYYHPSLPHVDEIVIKEVEFPNGRKFQFRYNAYGEIGRVVLPTGGAIEYDYETVGPYSITRRLTERRIYEDGSVFTGKAVYDYSFDGHPNVPGNETWTSEKNYDALNNLKSFSKTYFHTSWGAGIEVPAFYFPEYAGTGISGRVSKVETFDTDGTTQLRKVEYTYAARTQTSWTLGASGNLNKDTRISEVKTTLSDTNQVSKVTYGYSGAADFNLLSDTYEYDFGVGFPGNLIRRSHTDYLDYLSYSSHSVNLRSLPTETWTSSDAAGNNKLSRTKFEYDNYATDAHHAGLVDRANLTGHNASYGTGFTTRGNVTKVTSYAGAQNQAGAVSRYSQYDIAGNVVKGIDAKGHASEIDYTDRFGIPDGEARGQFGSGIIEWEIHIRFCRKRNKCRWLHDLLAI